MMEEDENLHYFLTYSGIGLPLKLVNPLDRDAILNRNTYFIARFDDHGRLAVCRKIVYGEVEFEHQYGYDEKGALRRAEITEEDETRAIEFDEQGDMV